MSKAKIANSIRGFWKGRNSGQDQWAAELHEAYANSSSTKPPQIPPQNFAPNRVETDTIRDPQQLAEDLKRRRPVSLTPRTSTTAVATPASRAPTDISDPYRAELAAGSQRTQSPPAQRAEPVRNEVVKLSGAPGYRVSPNDPGTSWPHRVSAQGPHQSWNQSSQNSSPEARPHYNAYTPPSPAPPGAGASVYVGEGNSVLPVNDTSTSQLSPQDNIHSPTPQGHTQDDTQDETVPQEQNSNQGTEVPVEPLPEDKMGRRQQTAADAAMIAATLAVMSSPSNRPEHQHHSQPSSRPPNCGVTQSQAADPNETSQFYGTFDNEATNGTTNSNYPSQSRDEDLRTSQYPNNPNENTVNGANHIQESDPANSNTDHKGKRSGLFRNRLTRQPKDLPPAPIRDPLSESEHEKRTEQRAKDALKPFKVDKTPGLTHMDTLLSWFPTAIRGWEDKYEQARSEISSTRKQIKQLEKDKETLDKELSGLQSIRLDLNDQKGRIHRLQQSLTKVRAERDEWQRAYDTATKSLATADKSAERAGGEATQLKFHLQASKEEGQRYLERNRGLDAEVARLSENLRKAEGELSRWSNYHTSETQRQQQENVEKIRRLENDLQQETRRWEHEIMQETQRLEGEKKQETDELRRQLQAAEHERDQEVQRLEREMKEATQRFEQEKQKISRRLEREKQKETDALRTQLEEADQKHGEEIGLLETTLQQEKEQYHREKTKLENSINARINHQTRRLNSQVEHLNNAIAAHNKDSWRPIPDDQFQISFQKLVQKVSNLVGFVPKPATPALNGGGIQQYDSTGYFTRSAQGPSGSRAWPRFVKSLCWSVYSQGFFHLQPGFGILGTNGEGFQFLQSLYELLTTEVTSEESDESAIVLRNDKDANIWRSSLFDLILKDVQNKDTADQEGKLANLFHANVKRVADELTEALRRISGGRLEPGGQVQIQDTSREMGLLALQMGSQRAHLMLGLATPGQRTRGGMLSNKFKDEAGAGNGSSVVEATTQPCLWKVGDGSGKTNTENVFVLGQIVSS